MSACFRDQGRPEVTPTIDLRNPQEAGWYLARPWPIACTEEPPVVVRVTPDAAGVTTVWRIGSRDPSTLAEWRLVGKVRADGRVTDLDLKEAHADGVRQGREEERHKQVEYEAQHDREHPEYPAWIDLLEQQGAVVAIRISLDRAERLSLRLSDFLCWAAGFNAALPRDETERAPIGVEAIRDINIALKSALRRADEAKEKNGHG